MSELLYLLTVIIFIFAVYNIIASSLGINYFSDCDEKSKYNIKIILIINVVFGIILVFMSFYVDKILVDYNKLIHKKQAHWQARGWDVQFNN